MHHIYIWLTIIRRGYSNTCGSGIRKVKIIEPNVGHLIFASIKVQQCSLSFDLSILTTSLYKMLLFVSCSKFIVQQIVLVACTFWRQQVKRKHGSHCDYISSYDLATSKCLGPHSISDDQLPFSGRTIATVRPPPFFFFVFLTPVPLKSYPLINVRAFLISYLLNKFLFSFLQFFVMFLNRSPT